MLCAFAGQSMLPTLVTGDLLELVDYGSRSVQVGDIICFRRPNDGYLVVHRVLGVGYDGIRTRGDGSAADDEWRVCPVEIIGRVIAVRRGDRRYEILGGRLGILTMHLHRLARRAAGRLGRVMCATLQPLITQTVVRFLPARLRPRLVVFNNQMRVFMANRCIGVFDVNQRRWRVRSWYQFFVDISKLPPQVSIPPQGPLGSPEVSLQ